MFIPTFSYIATIPSLSAPGPFNQEKSAFFKPTYAASSTPKHIPQLPIPVKTNIADPPSFGGLKNPCNL